MNKYAPLWNWIKKNGTAGIGDRVGKISMKEQTVTFEKLN